MPEEATHRELVERMSTAGLSIDAFRRGCPLPVDHLGFVSAHPHAPGGYVGRILWPWLGLRARVAARRPCFRLS